MITKAQLWALWALNLFLFLSSVLFAGTRDPDTPDSKYLEFGKQFPSVARIRVVVHYDDKDTYQMGSAVLIRPHWLLTAAHVVENSREPIAFLDGETAFPLDKVIIHRDFNNVNVGYYDIALAYSPKDFGLEFYPPLYTESDEMLKPVTIAGYGIVGTFATGAKEGDGLRRAGHNKVEGIERAILICKPNKVNKFPLEYIIAPGDSGGGLFIGNKLAGINSFLMAVDDKPDGTYTDEGAHTRVSLYAEWVDEQIKKYEASLHTPATIGAGDNMDVALPPNR